MPSLYDTHIEYYKRKFNTFYNDAVFSEPTSQPANLKYINTCIDLLLHYNDLTPIKTGELVTAPLIPHAHLKQISTLALAGLTLQDVTAGDYKDAPLNWLAILFSNPELLN